MTGERSMERELQERLTGVLIGIARAVDGNEHLISASTDEIVREALAATLPNGQAGEDRLRELVERAESEKRKLIPNCYACASPCGKNSNYDIRRLCGLEGDVRALKSLILCGIRCLAARGEQADRLFYQALFAVGEESFGVRELLPVAMEFGKVNLLGLAGPADNGGIKGAIH